MTTTKKSKESTVPASFEKAMERLELIVGEMDSGNLPLDQLIERFEEGQSLIGYCTNKLNEVEKKIEQITKKGDAIETKEFEEDKES